MDTTLKTTKDIATQSINLIDGTFTASEASHIINAVLDVKINFHKLNRLSITEGNADDACEYDSSRIQELINEKEIAKQFFKNIRTEGRKLKINSTISISAED